MSFINVLAVQLKKLNQSFYLNAFDLIDNGKANLLPIRTFIVKSFIALTSHFTEGAFNEILKTQQSVNEIRFRMYDEKRDVNKAINNLARDVKDVISFDKIDPSLVFFHEKNSQFFSIITNKSRNDKEYQALLNLKNSQFEVNQAGFQALPNYKIYKQIDFLKELKEILFINNPVEKDQKSEKKSLEEITGDYVITADNFVKMILILLRIRSGIPVIMMGETGCGKTSLIRKLSEMKNEGDKNKMKILNIHAGTNDSDIIKFINEAVIPTAKKNSRRRSI
jgi:midasin (ATPase involved in ribosome maturation)